MIWWQFHISWLLNYSCVTPTHSWSLSDFREDFGFTPYTTNFYMKLGHKAPLLKKETHTLTMKMRTMTGSPVVSDGKQTDKQDCLTIKLLLMLTLLLLICRENLWVARTKQKGEREQVKLVETLPCWRKSRRASPNTRPITLCSAHFCLSCISLCICTLHQTVSPHRCKTVLVISSSNFSKRNNAII